MNAYIVVDENRFVVDKIYDGTEVTKVWVTCSSDVINRFAPVTTNVSVDLINIGDKFNEETLSWIKV
jgi:hypothetical protein